MDDFWEDRTSIEPYKHDCAACVWVGFISNVKGQKVGNMYFCPKCDSKYGSIIIRFSDEPSDYWSAPVGAAVKGSLGVDSEFYEEWKAQQEERAKRFQ